MSKLLPMKAGLEPMKIEWQHIIKYVNSVVLKPWEYTDNNDILPYVQKPTSSSIQDAYTH